jgi:cell division protein FtsQ
LTGKAIFFLFVLILAGTVFLNSGYFTVRRVDLSGPAWMRAQVAALAGVRDGDNVWRIDPEAVAARIRRDPWVETVAVGRVLPDAISIRVTAATLAGLAPCGGYFYQISTAGVVLGRERTPLPDGVPFLTGGTGKCPGGKPLPAPLRDDLAALEALQKAGVKVDEVHSGAGGVTAYSGDGTVVFLGSSGSEASLSARLAPLSAVLTNLAKQGEKAGRIDVSRMGRVLVLPVKG